MELLESSKPNTNNERGQDPPGFAHEGGCGGLEGDNPGESYQRGCHSSFMGPLTWERRTAPFVAAALLRSLVLVPGPSGLSASLGPGL